MIRPTVAAAEAKFKDLQQKQDLAFHNQEVVSQTLEWTGIGLLAGAVLFPSRLNRTKPVTLSNTASDKLPI